MEIFFSSSSFSSRRSVLFDCGLSCRIRVSFSISTHESIRPKVRMSPWGRTKGLGYGSSVKGKFLGFSYQV